ENMDAGPANAISKPASAGPIARATLVEIAFNATAAGTVSRGIKVNVTASQADMLKALPDPRTKVSISNDQTLSAPIRLMTNSTAAAVSISACVNSSQYFRLTRSAMTPPGRPKRNTGSVMAVWISDTIHADSVRPAMIHAAPT